MKLTQYIRDNLAWVIDGEGQSRDELLHALSERVHAASSGIATETLYKALLEREGKGSTATPEGVALPHAMLDGITENFVAVALVRGGVDFQSPRVKSVDLVFMLIGPANQAWEHIRILARLARICHDPSGLARLRDAEDGADLYERLTAEDGRHV
ncbi:MAG: hypothetical protein GC162_04030 [Planctomycetes bacterium]|nr:hypothetical protein [Planctomycetota bacterium]